VLADLQSRLRDALLSDDAAGLAPLLVGGRAPAERLKVHQRHYETSLVAALLGTFPATQWLVGSAFVQDAARQYVRRHPPAAPCIAEYGDGFPSFLADCPSAARLPYLRAFGELEWHVGHVSVAVELPPAALASLSDRDGDAVAAATLAIQPGVRYLAARWPVDELFHLYLSDTLPERIAFDPRDTFLEVRGARGEFRLGRLGAGEFRFRQAIAAGHAVGAAAEMALASHAEFDVGAAFARLFAAGLVTGVAAASESPR
jgi:hypothetical protein